MWVHHIIVFVNFCVQISVLINVDQCSHTDRWVLTYRRGYVLSQSSQPARYLAFAEYGNQLIADHFRFARVKGLRSFEPFRYSFAFVVAGSSGNKNA